VDIIILVEACLVSVPHDVITHICFVCKHTSAIKVLVKIYNVYKSTCQDIHGKLYHYFIHTNRMTQLHW
jgi:hypothetical protein